MTDEQQQNASLYIAVVGTISVYITYIESSGHSILAGAIAGISGIGLLLVIGALINRSVR